MKLQEYKELEVTEAPTLLFTCDFDERTAAEAEMKGWFEAVIARLPDGVEIPLSFRDPVRLGQDLEAEVAAGRSCVAELALIVIPRVTRAHMEAAVTEIYSEGFFDRLVAIGRRNVGTEQSGKSHTQ